MGKREFIVLISMLMSLTALAVGMMLPAFAEMRAEFGLEPDSATVALVVTVFLVGFGLGQPVWGPLSDALGRKPILWLGLSIYIVGAIGTALAPSLAVILLLRVIGGFGGAALRVVALSMIRDRYQGEQMAKVLSYIMVVFLLVPMAAPSISTAILVVGDWRWIFGFFVTAAVLVAIWSRRLPESLPLDRRIELDLDHVLAAAKAVTTSRFAMGLTIAQMAAFGFVAAYLGSTELIIDGVFGLGSWLPLIFGVSSLMFGGAMLFNPRLIDRLGLRRLIRYTIAAYLGTTVLFAAIAIATGGRPPLWLYMVGILPIMFAHSFVMPNLNSAAMMPMGRIAGTAAAIIGSIATLGGAAIGAVIDAAFDGTIIPFAVAAMLAAIVAFVAHHWSDGVWEEDADRELMPSEDALPEAVAPADPA